MIESLQLYFDAFKNPAGRAGERKISYLELMGISWSLHLLYSFYSVFSLFLGVKSYNYFSHSKDLPSPFMQLLNFKFHQVSLFTTLFAVVFYPFLFQFGYKFWNALFNFYGNLFEVKDDSMNEKNDEILSSAFSSNIFLVLPIVGNILSNIALFFLIFKGLKRKYEFTSLQASLVLLTPLFLLFLFLAFTASYLFFIVTMI